MNPTVQQHPLEKLLVLVGAGNAHLQFVKRWSMRPLPGVAVTLINEFSEAPYSAMIPGHIMGDYAWSEVAIDLVRLCSAAKVRFVQGRVTGIDRSARRVSVAGRADLVYDAVSLGLGSLPDIPKTLASAAVSLSMRPMRTFVQRLEQMEARLRQSPAPFQLVVVGGGASGCELALAIHKRLHLCSGFQLTLLQGNSSLLPNFTPRAGRIMEAIFRERGIALRLNARVTAGEGSRLALENGEHLPFDAVVWATHAAPPELLRASGLDLDEAGFLRVQATLQSVTDPTVFGTGDCVSFVPYPELPKNGVHAVREGVVLSDNLIAFLRERPLTPFRPQRRTLSLLNTADGAALLTYGAVAWKGRLARRLKERIDRAWMEKFTPTSMVPSAGSPAGVEESYTMRCGGCGSKISSDVLSAVLRRIEVGDDPRVVLGVRGGEDAAVHRLRPELYGGKPDQLLEVQTVDYFKSFVDDPYLFGRIAAMHAVSDLFAMNARPFSALAIVALPYARGPVQEALLYELLSGATHTLRQAGMTLTGGHTTEGAELALGFSVTGHAEEDRLFRKSALQPGDVLILTKPVGSGALLAAWMRGACRAVWFDPLIETLLRSNGPAADIFSRHGVTACTDITGFGLAGHLLEMLDASQVSARIVAAQVPVLAGFDEVVAQGIVSTLQRDNAKVACRVCPVPASGVALASTQAAKPGTSDTLPAWFFDPQTSGGLLAGVNRERVDTTLAQLREHYLEAAVIGEVIPTDGGTPMIELVR